MTISSSIRKVTAAGNGVLTNFSFNFQVRQASDISVVYTNANGTQTTLDPSLYTVGLNAIPAGQLWPNGGTITYPLSGSPIASGTSLTIIRTVSYQQGSSLINQGGYYPQVVETALDLLTMETQQLSELVGRAIVANPVDVTPNMQLPPAAVRANAALGFDASGAIALLNKNNNVPVFSPSTWELLNYTSMKALTGMLDGLVVHVRGGNTEGDGQDGSFYWNSTSAAADDGFATIASNAGGTGRWIRLFGAVKQSGTPPTKNTVARKLREYVSVEDAPFNAAGDGVTDDTAAIQAAIDFGIQYSVPRIRLVDRHEYLFSDTLHIGYGAGAFTQTDVTLEGQTSGSILSLLNYTGPLDRPAINIQGTRSGGLRKVSLIYQWGSGYAVIQDMAYTGNEIWRRANVTNWYAPGAATTLSQAFCGVCVDAYSGNPTNKYPTVTYPAFLGGGIAQYNKYASSNPRIEDCIIYGFYIGCSISPNNSGSGDYVRLNGTRISYSAYGVVSSNQNGRFVDLTNSTIGACYCGITNKLSAPSGKSPFNLVNADLNSFGYKAFDIDLANPIEVVNCYAEGLTTVGQLASGGADPYGVRFNSCQIQLARLGPDGSTYVPPYIASLCGTFDNCSITEVYGLERIADQTGEARSYAVLEETAIRNSFTKGNFPTAAAPEAIGMYNTGGIVFQSGSSIADRPNRIRRGCGFSFNGANDVIIREGADRANGVVNVYCCAADHYGTRRNYKLAAADTGIYCTLGAVTVGGQQITTTITTENTNTIAVGDVLHRSDSTYVLLVQAYNSGTGAATMLVCTDYQKTAAGVYTLNSGTPATGTWYVLRPGKFPSHSGLALSCTSASNVIQVQDQTGAAIADATVYYAIGDTILVCPDNAHAVFDSTAPFTGFVLITNIVGANITVNKNALATVKVPAVPSLWLN